MRLPKSAPVFACLVIIGVSGCHKAAPGASVATPPMSNQADLPAAVTAAEANNNIAPGDGVGSGGNGMGANSTSNGDHAPGSPTAAGPG